jgi:hypothetical protein
MSGFRNRNASDIAKNRNAYMASLQQQEQINDMNLQVNKNYLLTGQLPTASQMQDTRTASEKLKDVNTMKQNIAKDLSDIAEPQMAYAIVNKIMNSPLNVNNSLFRFLAQRAKQINEQLKPLYPYKIEGDINDVEQIVLFINNMYNNTQGTFQSVKSYINSQGPVSGNSKVMSANDIDSIIMALTEIIKSLEMGKQNVIMDPKFYETPEKVTSTEEMTNMMELLIKKMINLKRVLPNTNQLNRFLQEQQTPNLPVFRMRSDNIRLMFDFLENKLPKYQDVMTLIYKGKQYLKTHNDTLFKNCMMSINELFGFVNDEDYNEIFGALDEFTADRRNEDIFINNQQETQNLEFIKRQTQEEKEKSKATKVFVMNDPLNVKMGGQPMPTGAEESKSDVEDSKDDIVPYRPPIRKGPYGDRGDINIEQLLKERYDFTGETNDDSSDFSDDSSDFYDDNSNTSSQSMNSQNSQINLLPDNTRENIKKNMYIRRYIQLSDGEKLQLKNRVGIMDDKQLLNSIINDPNYQIGDYNIGGLGIKTKPKKRSNFIGFGISEINNKSLENNIVKIRRPSSKSNYMDLPSRRVSPHMKNIISRIAGGGMPEFDDLSKMDNDEKIYLNKLLTKADLKGRLSVPAPSKDIEEKEIHEFEVLKGQIMSGNDNIQLVKKFKLLIRRLSQKQMLPRKEVNDMLDVLCDLGY